jgi:hypothetical protein
MSESEEPNRLNYRNPGDDVRSRTRGAVMLIAGLFSGIVATIISGFFVFDASGLSLDRSPSSGHYWPGVIIYILAATIAGSFAITFLRPSHRRFLIAGFCLGVLLMSLMEGTCFYNP